MLADGQGKLAVIGGGFSAEGVVPLDVTRLSGAQLRDSSGSVMADFSVGFKGSYNGTNKTIFPAQGIFSVGDYCYEVNDMTIDVYTADENGDPVAPVTKRAYGDLSKVSLPLPGDTSDLSATNDYGLMLDIKTVTVEDTTAALSLEAPPEGFDTVVYQNADGTTRYATLRKTAEGYELEAGDGTVTMDRQNLTGTLTLTKGQVKLAAGSITVAGTEYTVGAEGAVLGLGGSNEDRAVLTAGAVQLDSSEGGEGESIYVGNTKYTAAGTGSATLALVNGKATLAAGAVEPEAGGSILVGGTEYTAAEAGTKLALEEGKAMLGGGKVRLDKGESIYVGDEKYTAVQSDTELAIADGNARLTAGCVRLGENADGDFIYSAVKKMDGKITLELNQAWRGTPDRGYQVLLLPDGTEIDLGRVDKLIIKDYMYFR